MSKSVRIDYINANRTRFTGNTMCSTLDVSGVVFRTSQRTDRDTFLLVQIYELIKKDKEKAIMVFAGFMII